MQPSFAAFHFREKITRTQKFLRDMEQIIPWKILVSLVQNWKTSEVGRRGFEPETLLRMWLLQNWYGLSDEEVEDRLYETLSFQEFLKIDLGSPIPDATTLCRFRTWTANEHIQEKLFEEVNGFLNARGLFVKKGTLEDATIIESPKNKDNQSKDFLDNDAGHTKKAGRWYRGYKLHTGTDLGSNLIRKLKVTSARVHDSTCFHDLLSGDEKAIFADKAYYSEERKYILRRQNVFCGILDRAHRGKRLSSSQKKRNRKLSSIRAFVEHPYAVIKHRLKYMKTRYRGLLKNTAHMFGICMLYNLVTVRRKLLVQSG
jgi:IS5 family transposase